MRIRVQIMISTDSNEDDVYLTGQLLLAMPAMRDPRFAHSVIYMCAHGEDGAIGLLLNRLISTLPCADLLDQLGIAHIRQGLLCPLLWVV